MAADILCWVMVDRSPYREHSAVAVAGDGTVSIVPVGQGPETMAKVGRIKLVNPPAATVLRGEDGLFRTSDGAPAPVDANVRVASGVLESSNVNVAEAMVNMIELSRQFRPAGESHAYSRREWPGVCPVAQARLVDKYPTLRT